MVKLERAESVCTGQKGKKKSAKKDREREAGTRNKLKCYIEKGD